MRGRNYPPVFSSYNECPVGASPFRLADDTFSLWQGIKALARSRYALTHHYSANALFMPLASSEKVVMHDET